MNVKSILSMADHTLLRPTCTWDEIKTVLDEAIAYDCASACIPPSYVAEAVDYVGDDLAVCTVIGFSNGYDTTAAKMFMAEDALECGASEIDMVINLGWVKDKLYDLIEDEIYEIGQLADHAVLKVIIETSELTDHEKIRLCQVVTDAGADFIKTSTGFTATGATAADVKLLREHVGEGVGVKASGGIASLDDAARFIELGATRLGTSRLVRLAKAFKAERGTLDAEL